MTEKNVTLEQHTSILLLVRSLARQAPNMTLNLKVIGPINVQVNSGDGEVSMTKAFDLALDGETLKEQAQALPYRSGVSGRGGRGSVLDRRQSGRRTKATRKYLNEHKKPRPSK